MKISKLINKNKGFILISVLLMVAILLMLMSALLTLTTQTLYRATIDMKRSSLIPISDSAITEVFILIANDMNYGKNKEKLLMLSGKQNFNVSGISPTYLPKKNSEFDFEGDIGYYISFDPDDSAFTGKKYFSVNNLTNSAPVPSWKEGVDVPPYTVDIVITVVDDHEVKHVETMAVTVPDTNVLSNGSEYNTKFLTDNLTLNNLSYLPLKFHANYDEMKSTVYVPYVGPPFPGMPSTSYIGNNNISMEINSLSGSEPVINMEPSVSLSASNQIKVNGVDPNDTNKFKSNIPQQETPHVSISNMVSDINFEPVEWPRGRYVITEIGKLRYYEEVGTSDYVAEYNDGEEIIPGVIYTSSPPCITVSKNIKVVKWEDANIHCKMLSIEGAGLRIENGANLYLDGKYDFNAGGCSESSYGLNIGTGTSSGTFKDYSYISGKGNIYSNQTIQIFCNGEEAVDCNISMYTETNLRLYSKTSETVLSGLLYSNEGRINIIADNNLIINGALIAGGGSLAASGGGSYVGTVTITADNTTVNFDDKVYGKLCASGNFPINFRSISWYEF